LKEIRKRGVELSLYGVFLSIWETPWWTNWNKTQWDNWIRTKCAGPVSIYSWAVWKRRQDIHFSKMIIIKRSQLIAKEEIGNN
jgi:hypothetical protein